VTALQLDHGGPSIGFIAKRFDIRMALQNRVNDLALNAYPTSMNDSHVPETAADGLVQVFFNDCRDVTRLERVKVNRILDRDFVHKRSI